MIHSLDKHTSSTFHVESTGNYKNETGRGGTGLDEGESGSKAEVA